MEFFSVLKRGFDEYPNLMSMILRCPVCYEPLHKEGKTYVCPHRHSYDISKSGYVNLMLANQGRHLEEGDTKESLTNRQFFLEKGYYSFLRERLVQLLTSLNLGDHFEFADLGCGEGYYTSYLASSFPNAHFLGVDISKNAINMLSKRAKAIPNLEGVVGNLDYLPIQDETIDVALNCFAPICEKEFRRILKASGYYIRVLPSENHLIELKQALYEVPRSNTPKELEMEGFEIIKKEEISKKVQMPQEDFISLFLMTPYAFKSDEDSLSKLKAIPELEMTIGFDIRLYRLKTQK